MAKITVALLRDLERKVTQGKISYSRMVEILNEHKDKSEELPKQSPFFCGVSLMGNWCLTCEHKNYCSKI